MRYVPLYPNRTLCDVLREMRKACKTANYSYMPGLIEEVQCLGSRMEAGLEDQRDLYSIHEDLKKARKELKELYTKIEKAEEMAETLEQEEKS